jgi:hypothetical protein
VWKALGAAGLILAVVGAVQVADGWNPTRLGNAYWLYRVAGGTLDGMSLITAGILALGASLIAQRSYTRLRLLTLVNAMLFIIAGVVYVAFLTSLPRVRTMAEAANDMHSLKTAVILTTITALASMFTYAFVGWLGWRTPKEV